MRRIVRTIHLWIGLSLGALFVLLGLTGSVLVFYNEIDAILNPAIAVESSEPPDWDRAISTVRQAFPDKTGPWRFEVTGDGGAIPARYNNPSETAGQDFAPMLVWLSPDGGQVVRQTFWGQTVMTFIYDLHFRLLGGEVIGTVIGYAGIILFLLLITGLWAWWPRGSWRKALRYKGNGSRSRVLRDQHKLAGLWGLPLLLVLTVTGVMLELPDETDAVVSASFGPLDVRSRIVSTRFEGRQIPASEALKTAQKALPEGRVAWIEVPGRDDGAFRFRMAAPGDPSSRFPHSFVWIDQYSGSVLAVSDARAASTSTTINNWSHPLHDGSFGGLMTRILAAIAGLIPLFLFITGWKRWRLRATGALQEGAILQGAPNI